MSNPFVRRMNPWIKAAIALACLVFVLIVCGAFDASTDDTSTCSATSDVGRDRG